MRKQLFLLISIGTLAALLTGCWDINYLTNKKMINGISFDAAENGLLTGTVRSIVLISKGGGQFDVKDQMSQATGDSVASIGAKIDSKLPGTLEASKTHVMIMGEELAKKGVLDPLETFFRSNKAYLTSNILISKGLASEILKIQSAETTPIAFSIMQMINGAERSTYIPEHTLFSIWPQISDPGEDVVLPIVRKLENNEIIIDSSGLFDGDKFTGVTLPRNESSLLLLLSDRLKKLAYLDIPVGSATVNFDVHKVKRKLQLSVNEATQAIECFIKLDLYGNIRSYPSKLMENIDREKLNQQLAESLNKQAEVITDKLLKANCDAFGIGRKIRTSYPTLWSSVDWKTKYKEVKMKPEIIVHIKSTGIIK